MISNYIFKLLSLDATDSTANAVLADVQKRNRMPSLTAPELPDYLFKSLKTLLGESGNNTNNEHGLPQWAVKRIIDIRKNVKFRRVEDPDYFPVILVGVNNVRPDPDAQWPGREVGVLDLLVQTNPDIAPSSLAVNIRKRIDSLFIQYTTESGMQTYREIATSVTGVKGLLSLQVSKPHVLIESWDIQRVSYNFKSISIQ